MEMMDANIKIEPNAELQNAVSEFSIEDIKPEPTSDDPTIAEFDERIFQHNPSDHQYKELADPSDCLDIEDGNFVFVDEIIKEEPIFQDSSYAEILQSTQDDTKKDGGWQTASEEQDSSENIDSPPNADENKLFKCQHCSETFHQKWIFHRHQRLHGVQNSFGCDLCSRKFSNKLRLIAHERIHKTKKPSMQKQPSEPARKLASKKDGNGKASATSAKKQKSKKKKPLFECQHCSRTFRTALVLKRHEIRHREKLFNCNLCPRSFATEERLTAHERIHTGQQPFECEVCHKKFNHKYHIEHHKRIHTGEKPYECDMCGMRFRLKHLLEVHFEARSKDSTHQLTRTSKNSIIPMEKIMAEQHSLEVRVYECCLCHIQCYKNELRKHVKTEHCGETFLSCKKCGLLLSDKYRLNQHHLRAHSTQLKLNCQVCGRQFHQADSLKYHVATHVKSYQCKFCPKKLSTESILRAHLKTHTGLRPFECEIESCKKTFLKRSDMVRHKQVHTGEKPHTCDVCQKTFTRKHTLTKHKEKMHAMNKK